MANHYLKQQRSSMVRNPRMSLLDTSPYIVPASSTVASQFVRTFHWHWPGLIAQRLVRGLARRRHEAQVRREIARLSSHLMKDIGLSPRQVWAVRQDSISRY